MRAVVASVLLAGGALCASRCEMTVSSDGDASDAHEDPCPRGVPDAPEFTCAPVPVDAATCIGPPVQCAEYAGDAAICDPDLGYPANCALKLPVATTFCGPLTCYCYSGGWTCPN